MAVPAEMGTKRVAGLATGIVLALGPSGAAMPMGMEVSTGGEMGEGMGDADGYVTLSGAGYGCGSACGDGELEGNGAGYGYWDNSYVSNYGSGEADGHGGVLGMGNG